MNEPLDELYLKWLYSQIGSIRTRNRSRTYWALARQLYTTEFTWIVPNDSNRAEDGKDLRIEFLHDQEVEADRMWLDLGCSMLELLITLSRALSFELEGEPRAWFWELIDNLGLQRFTDEGHDPDEVDYVIQKLITRSYKRDGSGGLFPLHFSKKDQRNVELWYQLSAYAIERF